MNILMLGWEYPPHIAGGLGIACEGLTKGLARPGTQITFIVPHLYGEEVAPHMNILDSRTRTGDLLSVIPHELGQENEIVRLFGIEAFLKPYWTEEEYSTSSIRYSETSLIEGGNAEVSASSTKTKPLVPAHEPHYGLDIYEEVSSFTQNVVHNFSHLDCDVIHAHDWMTYPAGVALSKVLGKPLVVHVHSLEYDRSGSNVNHRIHAIEHLGIASADAVIAVSHYTKNIVHQEHNIPTEKIYAVHNGIYPEQAVEYYKSKQKYDAAHIVLFLGRVTFQKGPEYFVKAAAKVIHHVPDVLFIMAGSGDMLDRIRALTEELQISTHFHFPGFLRGREVEKVFSVADLYVMPSVSEPFGLSALEAINFNVPTLISRQSGVAEVVSNSLKFDFWDVDRLADLIITCLIHEEMRLDMIEMARKELDQLRWDASARKTMNVYETVVNQGS